MAATVQFYSRGKKMVGEVTNKIPNTFKKKQELKGHYPSYNISSKPLRLDTTQKRHEKGDKKTEKDKTSSRQEN